MLLLCCAGCVSLPESRDPGSLGLPPPRQGVFQGLAPGAASLTSPHFEVRAYDAARARELSALVESAYNRIIADTGLFSFRSESLYAVVLYRSGEEFFSKTNLSAGIAAGAVDDYGYLYVYEGAPLPAVVAHETSHLVLRDFMGSVEPVWLNEGLAVYEGQQAASESAAFFGGGRPMPFEEMSRPDGLQSARLSSGRGFRAACPDHQGGLASERYRQAGSVVRFMIEKGGRAGFSAFLRALRSGRDLDSSLAASFPRWKDLGALEAEWRLGQ